MPRSALAPRAQPLPDRLPLAPRGILAPRGLAEWGSQPAVAAKGQPRGLYREPPHLLSSPHISEPSGPPCASPAFCWPAALLPLPLHQADADAGFPLCRLGPRWPHVDASLLFQRPV